jgi:hypothetical protein
VTFSNYFHHFLVVVDLQHFFVHVELGFAKSKDGLNQLSIPSLRKQVIGGLIKLDHSRRQFPEV